MDPINSLPRPPQEPTTETCLYILHLPILSLLRYVQTYLQMNASQ